MLWVCCIVSPSHTHTHTLTLVILHHCKIRKYFAYLVRFLFGVQLLLLLRKAQYRELLQKYPFHTLCTTIFQFVLKF